MSNKKEDEEWLITQIKEGEWVKYDQDGLVDIQSCKKQLIWLVRATFRDMVRL